MPASISEALRDQKGQMATANEQGIDVISEFQEITFIRYVRLVLPLDGFVFWVRAGLVTTDSAVLNEAPYNEVVVNAGAAEAQPDVQNTKTIQGSLHYATSGSQGEDENYDSNRVSFTAENEVSEFNTVAPNEMWLGSFENIRFAFTSRSTFYAQAGLWHYVGDAVYSDTQIQIIDDLNDFSAAQIVSNSLPIWLSMNSFGTEWAEIGLPMLSNVLPLFPSFLSPLNMKPPFATVHVVSDMTQALAAAPTLSKNYSHSQLATDTVLITFWGVRNDGIMDFVDFVNNFTEFDTLGIMNMPIPCDEKRTQSELLVLAQKKVVEYRVSYNQFSARDVARRLIKKAVPQYLINDYPV